MVSRHSEGAWDEEDLFLRATNGISKGETFDYFLHLPATIYAFLNVPFPLSFKDGGWPNGQSLDRESGDQGQCTFCIVAFLTSIATSDNEASIFIRSTSLPLQSVHVVQMGLCYLFPKG